MDATQREIGKLLSDLKAVFPPGSKIVQGLEDAFQRLTQQIEAQPKTFSTLDSVAPDRWEDIDPTDLERRILNALWASRGRGMSARALLEAVYFDRPEIDWPPIKLISIKICHLRKKIEDVGMDMWIETVWGVGYRLREGAPPACRGIYQPGVTRFGPPV